jgi:hypothetical protein
MLEAVAKYKLQETEGREREGTWRRQEVGVRAPGV